MQIGLAPERAVILRLDPASIEFLLAIDGSRELPDLLAHAADLGLVRTDCERLLDLLATHGALGDAAADTRPLRDLEPAERDRLRPDLAALSLRRPGRGMAVLGRRRGGVVTVHGVGRVGAVIAHQLAGAGVGTVIPIDTGLTRALDVMPGGLGSDAVGVPRQNAVRDQLRRTAPSVRTTLPAGRRRPDLAVLALPDRWPSELAATLMDRGTAHLVVLMRDSVAQLGPLVVPGSTACLRCQDLHRTDRDSAWPRLLGQLINPSAPGDPHDTPCDTALASLLATFAALHVLSYLDGETPPSANATLELSLPWGDIGRRVWFPHPACGCTGLAAREAGETSGHGQR